MKRFGLHDESGPWPLGDAFLDWSVSPSGSAVTYHLRDRTTQTRLAIGRFTSSNEYVFPSEPLVSTNGRTLVLIAEVFPQSQGLHYEDAVIDLPAAAALLYLDAADEAPTNAALRERANHACGSLTE